MSHFLTLVLVPENDADDVTGYVDDVMERFNENREVDEYDRECGCVNWKAEMSGRDKVNFSDRLQAKREDLDFQALPEDEKRRVWGKFLDALKAEALPHIKAHALYMKPDPDCDECFGTGTYRSTYNPESKWDWYEIGGRWDGWLNGINYKLLKDVCLDDLPHMPFAIVTSDGEWREKGEMGWFACVSNENADWQDIAKQTLLNEDQDCIAVVVDCHI